MARVLVDLARGPTALVGVAGFGGVFATFVVWETARQHMKNPAWSPHAKFHNGQALRMGVVSGLVTLYLLFGFRPQGLATSLTAIATASTYWLGMFGAKLFPGTDWGDPEFDGGGKVAGVPAGLVASGSFLTLALVAAVCAVLGTSGR